MLLSEEESAFNREHFGVSFADVNGKGMWGDTLILTGFERGKKESSRLR